VTLEDDDLRVVDEPIDDRGRGRGVPKVSPHPLKGRLLDTIMLAFS